MIGRAARCWRTALLAIVGWSWCATALAGPTPKPTAHPQPSAATPSPLQTALRDDLRAYLGARSRAEHISAISLSVSRAPGAALMTATASVPAFGWSGPVTAASLFQIGSNTKAFTAATMLQLEAAGKLSIDQTVGHWLPQYPQWKNVTIRHLLDMTSGIPTYDDTQAWERAMAADPYHFFSPAQLIGYVAHAPLHSGYYYSNTAYIVAMLVIEKASGASYARELRRRLFAPLGLSDTHYEAHLYPEAIYSRMVPGYFANADPDNAGLRPLLGKDVRRFSVSWMQSAGAIVSTPSDVVRWVRALYQGAALLPRQRRELTSIISTKTGQPMAITTAGDPRGFGLGVVQMLKEPLGRFWFYEGETLGYRMVYVYDPRSNLVFAVGVNSQPPDGQDRIGQLMATLYTTILHYPK